MTSMWCGVPGVIAKVKILHCIMFILCIQFCVLNVRRRRIQFSTEKKEEKKNNKNNDIFTILRSHFFDIKKS